MLGLFGKLFVGFFAVVAALGGVGLWQMRKAAPEEKEEILSQKAVDNVLDLNDRFNRARYNGQSNSENN